jgi:16S rRNA (guanine1516-N2)-methyltransferase
MELASALSLQLLDARTADWRGLACRGLLLVSVAGLALGLTGRGGPSPVAVDFCSGALLHRLRGIGPRREDLARAVGLPAPRQLQVVDATAGWGRDSAVLAALGCAVTMIERHAVVAALLADGVARASLSAEAEVQRFLPRLRLVQADAADWLMTAADPQPDVVLLDPMFPDRAGSAAVRKEMVLFQRLVGDDADAERLLVAALDRARHRVVVKRPLAAPPLQGRAPDFSLKGKSTRFDVYALRRIS